MRKIYIIDASGNIIVPGFIDSHVHTIGGGGEGSYKTRTPEIQLTDATLGGITTVNGVIATEGSDNAKPDCESRVGGGRDATC